MADPSNVRISGWSGQPLGAAVSATGVDFAIVSRRATRVWLALFARPEDATPAFEVALEPETHRFGDVWSVHVEGLGAGALYAYRMDGPHALEKGHRYNAARYLIDPYAMAVTGIDRHSPAKCVVIASGGDVHGARRPRVPMSETIIYEVHVKGFTQGEGSGVAHPGTYQGFIEKIPYLEDLGVTAVELLPIQESGERRLERVNPMTGEVLTNYWGYNPIAWFAPTEYYSSGAYPGCQVEEFRELVAALHRAGIEVILDVLFNHTSHGEGPLPAFGLQGIDNALYYMLDGKGEYLDFTGCGNTLNCNHPVVQDLIVDSLRYWVRAFGVDGFRFDLASVFYRDRHGHRLEHPPLVTRLAEDPILREVKLIAEPWDCAGGHHLGRFGERWAEWNDDYRDGVRRFWHDAPFAKNILVQRMGGSPDVSKRKGSTPQHSVNFVTCHDGFTLQDLVSYALKHNEANGHNATDGADNNLSWNCGVEGETDNGDVNALRLRLQKNCLATLFLSLGVPMLLGGDEFGRTQRGNNNAYCQDNEVSWFDWRLLDTKRELHRFCKALIEFRRANPVLARRKFFVGIPSGAAKPPDLLWTDAHGRQQTWAAPEGLLAGLIRAAENQGTALNLLLNPSEATVKFHVPGGQWRLRIDTFRPCPEDCWDAVNAPRIAGEAGYVVGPKSLVVLDQPTE